MALVALEQYMTHEQLGAEMFHLGMWSVGQRRSTWVRYLLGPSDLGMLGVSVLWP